MNRLSWLLIFGLTGMASVVVKAETEDYRVTTIRFFPAPGLAEKMKDGRFTGSNTSATNDFVEIARIAEAPPEGEWTTIEVERPKAYRFIKYEGPHGSYGAVAELEFRAGERVLKGEPFGTAGTRGEAETSFDKALDGLTETYFEGKEPNNQYVGWDLGPQSQVEPLTVSIEPGLHPEPVEVELRTGTEGATIYYSVRGEVPRADASSVVSGPIRLEQNTLLMALATKEGLADTPLFVGAYRIGEAGAARAGIRTFHIGNSLTDTVNNSLQPLAASAGKEMSFHRFTIPGAPTDWLWNHPGTGFGDNRYVEAFQVLAPIDHITTQPFAGHNRSVANEAEHSAKFFEEARKSSPEIQPWIYVQWPGREFQDHWSRGEFDRPEGMEVTPATDYAGAIENHLRYAEAVKA
ncbi:MAG: chitobiase/beta-hexosaminidase C-terminal domain-containing protein, partial [Verrucomicrobiia bacterium]